MVRAQSTGALKMEPNPMDPNDDAGAEPLELPDVPGDAPEMPLGSGLDLGPDLSQDLGPAIPDDGSGKIGRGTPIWVWPLMLLLIGGVVAGGIFYWQGEREREHRWDAYRAAQSE